MGSWWAHKVDNGYFIWSFQGRILQRHALDQFCHFVWRPRPVSLLTKEDIQRIKMNLKRYQKEFEIKDRMSQTKASKEMIEKRRSLFNEFSGFREKHHRVFHDTKQQRLDLREGIDTDSLESAYDEIDEETVEFFIREETEVIESTDTTEAQTTEEVRTEKERKKSTVYPHRLF